MTIGLRERNKAAAMDEVRRVAFDLMDTHGFDGVTVEQVAAATTVSPSSVYRYFGTKEALVLSTERPLQLVDRLRADRSDCTSLEAFERAARKVWGRDDVATVELGLVIDNPTLMQHFEQHLLDQRSAVAAVFAQRRLRDSPGLKDHALASASIAVLISALLAWRRSHGKKSLSKTLAKSFDAIRDPAMVVAAAG